MSLNYKEIDQIISEMDICGTLIQKIVQPAYDTVCFYLYEQGKTQTLLFCLAHGACRLNITNLSIPKPEKPQRFMELLRSQLRGGRIQEIVQLGQERIVRLTISRSGEAVLEDESDRTRYLYARLWSGAANMILCKTDGTIIDVLSRKPQKNEIAGAIYKPEQIILSQENQNKTQKEYTVREIPGDDSFNSKIDKYYAEQGSELSLEAVLEKSKIWFSKKRMLLQSQLENQKKNLKELENANRYKEIGDILLANQNETLTSQFILLDDFYNDGKIQIRVDPKKSIVENAKNYYEKSKKAKSGAALAVTEIAELEEEIQNLSLQQNKVESTNNPHVIRLFLSKNRISSVEEEKKFPGLSFEQNGWLYLIGRSAKENDELLRKHVKGNDYWFHARDYSGSYIFIKSIRGKSLPLEIIKDATMLALYYSKGRAAIKGDIYFTQVKYLRRAKEGPKGLVIPTQEKNYSTKIDDKRIRELLRLIGR